MSEESRDVGETPVSRVQLEELHPEAPTGSPLAAGSLDLVYDVRVRLTVSVGGAQLTIGELYALKDGQLLKLDKVTSDPVDVFLDGRLVARGELMAAGDNFAVRITELGGRS